MGVVWCGRRGHGGGGVVGKEGAAGLQMMGLGKKGKGCRLWGKGGRDWLHVMGYGRKGWGCK